MIWCLSVYESHNEFYEMMGSQLDVRSPGTFQKLNIIEWQVGGTDWHIFSLFVQQKYLTDMANSNSLAIYNLQIQNTKSKYINNL